MAKRTCDLGDTQQFLHTGEHSACVTVWAAFDKPNNRALSHVEIYMRNEGGYGSLKVDLSCDQLEKLAGDCMRIMAYRHELEARILPPCPQCKTHRESPEDAACLYCGRVFGDLDAAGNYAVTEADTAKAFAESGDNPANYPNASQAAATSEDVPQ